MVSTVSHTDYYGLTNSYTGPSFFLAVNPSSSDYGLRVASKDDYSLSWQFLSAQDPTKYNICTTYEGTSYCLDIVGGDITTPHLAAPGFVTGQQWTLTPQGNTYKFSNDYSGTGYFLDTYSNNEQAFMSTGDSSGQYWTLNDEGGGSGGAAPSSPVSVSSVSSPASTIFITTTSPGPINANTVPTTPSSPNPIATTPGPTPAPASSDNGLSTGAKVGAIISPVIAVIGIGLGLFFRWRAWKKKQKLKRGY